MPQMKRTLIAFLLVLGLSCLKAQPLHYNTQLSSQAFASLITCGPGMDFYTTWGHTALRICDSNAIITRMVVGSGATTYDTIRGIDVVYNYGTFDFDTPHFYLKFAKGQLNYCLSRSSYSGFLSEYVFEGRWVTEQRLNLTNEQINKLFVAMEDNYLPQNRYYKYDFFKDNCATRIKDQINHCAEPNIPFPETISDTNYTYRDILDSYMKDSLEWWRLGIDIILGRSCDIPVSSAGYEFCPFYLQEHAATTQAIPDFAPRKEYLLTQTHAPIAKSLHPLYIFIILLLAFGIIVPKSNPMRKHGFDYIFFAVTGLVSLLICFLWFLSDHYCTQQNLNILWASPLYLYFAIAMRKSWKPLLYLQLAALLAYAVLAMIAHLQYVNPSFYCIVALLFIRTLNLAIEPKKNKKIR